jgi:hypothetical protein
VARLVPQGRSLKRLGLNAHLHFKLLLDEPLFGSELFDRHFIIDVNDKLSVIFPRMDLGIVPIDYVLVDFPELLFIEKIEHFEIVGTFHHLWLFFAEQLLLLLLFKTEFWHT